MSRSPRSAALAAFGALLALAAPAAAQDEAVLSVGYYDLFDDEEAISLTGEWRPDVRYARVISPFLGAMVTSEGALYGYFGFGLDFDLTDRLQLYPNLAAGLYADGGGKDLGSVVEFRSGLELSYRVTGRGDRAGVTFHHISNAGIDERNPGTEILAVYYSFPFGPAR